MEYRLNYEIMKNKQIKFLCHFYGQFLKHMSTIKVVSLVLEMIKNDDGDEKQDEEKSDDGLTKAESEDEEIEDEESKYITEEYAPILVSVHQDSFIRFWTMEVIKPLVAMRNIVLKN